MHFQLPFEIYQTRFSTKHSALYHALRDVIVDGTLLHGMRLPSTRELASLYGLSRGTVNQVYETLASEGYLRCKTGKGTFVAFRHELEESGSSGEARHIEDKIGKGKADEGKQMLNVRNPSSYFQLSPWGYRLEVTPLHTEPLRPGTIGFHQFTPDLNLFPSSAWNRCLFEQVRNMAQADSGILVSPPQGDWRLRDAIARYLRRARSIAVTADEVAITGGSMQAIALLAQLLIGPGESAAAEWPGYSGIRRAIHAAGGVCLNAAVDLQGIIPKDWDAKALFVTPTRQFPTGAVLSLERRQALLRWAAAHQAVIIEDDYDSEFRHRGKALEPLKALDKQERVVYIGSFSKTMPAQVRIGYVVLPRGLKEPFVQAQALFEPYPVQLLEQKALAAFMDSGEYERHLRRMKRTYSQKLTLISTKLSAELNGVFDWIEGDAGLQIFGWWRGSLDAYRQYRSRCREAGVYWSETTAGQESQGRQGIYLHYAHLSDGEIVRGVELMKAAVERKT